MSTHHRTHVGRATALAAAFLLQILLSALAEGAATILTDHGSYLPGERIITTFRGGPGQPKDWVGIYPEGIVPGTGVNSTIWFYTDGTGTGVTGLTEGTVTFADGLNLAGDWVAYLLANDGYTILAQTKFTVADPSAPLLRLNKRTYAPGETISVGFTNGPANVKDWIGIYPQNRLPGDGTSLIWFYVDGTQTGSTGKSEGVIDFPGGLTATGDYVAYLLENDVYTILASESFTVAQPASTGPRVLSIQPANNATNLPPILQFTATITNGVSKLATNSVALQIDNTVVAHALEAQGELYFIGYTNQTLLAPSSVHTYRLTFADAATPANNYTNQGSFTVAIYQNIVLPAPIYFEDFDATPEGSLPAGWTSTSYSAVNDENFNLQDLNSKSYANWLVVNRDRFTQDFLSYDAHDATSDYQRVLSLNPTNVVNGRFVQDLVSGRFVFGNSGYRDGGNQYLILLTPDFDLTGRTNVHLSFHSIWEQNQDSFGAVEYSTNQGQAWLPITYMLDRRDVLTNDTGVIDAIATLTTDYADVARYTDPVTGEEKGGTYGAFIGAPVTAELAPFLSGRLDDNPVDSKRVALFRLVHADNQPKVRFRFAHAGTDSWYFGVDNFGLHSLSTSTEDPVSLLASRSGNELLISWPSNAIGFTLESTDSLSAPSWATVTGVANNSVRVPIGAGQRFYRLRK